MFISSKCCRRDLQLLGHWLYLVLQKSCRILVINFCIRFIFYLVEHQCRRPFDPDGPKTDSNSVICFFDHRRHAFALLIFFRSHIERKSGSGCGLYEEIHTFCSIQVSISCTFSEVRRIADSECDKDPLGGLSWCYD